VAKAFGYQPNENPSSTQLIKIYVRSLVKNNSKKDAPTRDFIKAICEI